VPRLFSGHNPLAKSAALLRPALEGPRLFLVIIAAAIIVLFFWASIAPIDRVVRTEGKIIPAGRSRQIQHLEGGIVAAISTYEGAAVKKDDLLLTIDDTAASANLSETKSKLTSQLIRARRLESEARNLAAISFPPDLADLDASEAERRLFLSRKDKFNEALKVHQEMIRQRTAELEEIKKRRISLDDERTIAHKRLQMYEKMLAHNAASQMEVLEAQSRERRLETEINDAESSKPRVEAAIAGEKAQISTLGANFHSEVQNDLVITLAEIDRLKQIMTSEVDRKKRTEIRAPIDGIINRIAVNTTGSVVRPGEAILELTPNTNEVLIEAKALPRDRGELRPGVNAKVRVSAYDAAELGTLSGRVTEISADTMQDPRGDAYYRVKILVNSIPDSYAEKPMLPGMTVTADIVTGRRTLLNYLFSPLLMFTHKMFRDPR
jgi:membrane fusion protein, adhesin transport system